MDLEEITSVNWKPETVDSNANDHVETRSKA